MNVKCKMPTLWLTLKLTPNSLEGQDADSIESLMSIKSEIPFNLISWATRIHRKA